MMIFIDDKYINDDKYHTNDDMATKEKIKRGKENTHHHDGKTLFKKKKKRGSYLTIFISLKDIYQDYPSHAFSYYQTQSDHSL